MNLNAKNKDQNIKSYKYGLKHKKKHKNIKGYF